MQTLLLETKILTLTLNPRSVVSHLKKNKLVQKLKSSLQILNWFQKLQKKKI